MFGIELFSGAGGMSAGAVDAGIDVQVAIEKDPHAASTYAQNFPDVKVIINDICRIKDFSGVRMRVDDETIIFGGPPCQGFSTSNQRTRSSKNPINWLFKEMIRFIKGIKPDWVVMENVKGIIETEGAFFHKQILRELENLNYTVASWMLNASDYGVPQKRARVFIVGSLHGIELSAPPPERYKFTVRDAISDLPILSNGASLGVAPYATSSCSRYAKRLRGRRRITYNHLVTRNASHILKRYAHVSPGGNWEMIPSRLMKNYADRTKCHAGLYRRLSWDEPSSVIGNYRKNMLIHPDQDRGLSVREAARLQSFPDTFKFTGSIGFQQQQVGNAVPPFLAQAVFQQILSAK